MVHYLFLLYNRRMNDINKKAFKQAVLTVTRAVVVLAIFLIISVIFTLMDSGDGGGWAWTGLFAGFYIAVSVLLVFPILFIINRNNLSNEDKFTDSSGGTLKQTIADAVKMWLIVFIVFAFFLVGGILLLIAAV